MNVKSDRKAILKLAAEDAGFRARLLQELETSGVKIELLTGRKGATMVAMARPIPVLGSGGGGGGPKPGKRPEGPPPKRPGGPKPKRP